MECQEDPPFLALPPASSPCRASEHGRSSQGRSQSGRPAGSRSAPSKPRHLEEVSPRALANMRVVWVSIGSFPPIGEVVGGLWVGASAPRHVAITAPPCAAPKDHHPKRRPAHLSVLCRACPSRPEPTRRWTAPAGGAGWRRRRRGWTWRPGGGYATPGSRRGGGSARRCTRWTVCSSCSVRCPLPFHCPSTAILLSFTVLPLPFHCHFTVFHCPSTALPLSFYCLSLSCHCLSLPFHRPSIALFLLGPLPTAVPLPFHCPSTAILLSFHCPFTAFHQYERAAPVVRRRRRPCSPPPPSNTGMTLHPRLGRLGQARLRTSGLRWFR